MKLNQLLIPAFVLMILAQWFVPGKMIRDSEKIYQSGTAYKFKLQPIDPNDPFRGKYITLDFEADEFELPEYHDFERGTGIYVKLRTDSSGFAQIKNVSHGSNPSPSDEGDFILAEVRKVWKHSGGKSSTVRINYPFQIFYMEESKAYDAEVYTRRGQLDSNQVAYALVNVLNGRAVIKDVFVDDIPIREFVLQQQEENDD